jgi:hypothetical protein
MNKTVSFILSFFFLMSFFCCGKKGDILPPLVRLPQTVEDLQVIQRGNRILLTWQNPTTYVDGSALSDLEIIEIWVFKTKKETENTSLEVDKDEFPQKAQLAFSIERESIPEYTIQAPGSNQEMQFFYDLSEESFLSYTYTFGLRVKGRKRYSDFSDLVSLEPLLISLPPWEVEASVYQDRIEIVWKAPVKNMDQSAPPNFKGYNVYRLMPEENARRINLELVKSEKYADRNFDFSQTYRYFVRASATDMPPFFESLDSDVVEVLAKDSFPPQSPSGLISVGAEGMIAISWDENSEEDLAGYRVWRREEKDKDFRLLTPQAIKENSFSDPTVEIDKKYDYAVTAMDNQGNESQKSKVISDSIRKRL